jgi:hypothetical protein
MNRFHQYYLFPAAVIRCLAFPVLAFATPAIALSLDLANDAATGESGKSAAGEIRRTAFWISGAKKRENRKSRSQ